MSAIPWLGQDIVESQNTAECLSIASYIPFISQLSKEKTELPVIGTISPKVHINRKIRLTKAEYLSIPTTFIAFLVGFIDGDGYIQITGTEKGYIAIKLTISIHLNDISVLYYIQSLLKIGIIKSYPHHKSPCCRLIINKTEL